MKVLLTGDLHLRDTPPRSCTDQYLPDLFDHLTLMAKFCNAGGADAVVIAGDLFDLQNARNNSHRLIQKVMKVFKSYKVPIYVLIGNHDQIGHNVHSVFDTQPLGVLYHSGIVRLLSGWAHDPQWKKESYSYLHEETDPLPIFGVPWLAEWDYQDGPQKEDAIFASLENLSTESFSHTLIVMHAPLFPPGEESPYENYPTPQLASHINSVYNDPKSVFYGHVHEYHGIYETGGIAFANAGALSRGSLTEANINRPIRLTIWDSDTGKFEIFGIPHKPASLIYKMEEAKERKQNKLELDDYIMSLGHTVLDISSTDTIVNQAKDQNTEEKVIRKVQELLELVEK